MGVGHSRYLRPVWIYWIYPYIGWIYWLDVGGKVRSEKHERKGPSALSIFSEDVLEEPFLGALSESPALLECSYFQVYIIQGGIISVRDLASSHFLDYNRLPHQNLHFIFCDG